jgi:hypothetical protein
LGVGGRATQDLRCAQSFAFQAFRQMPRDAARANDDDFGHIHE